MRSVKVDYIRRLQRFLHLLIGWFHLLFQALVGRQHTGFAQLVTIQVTEHSTGTRQGNELVGIEVAGLRLDTKAILDWAGHAFRKRRLAFHSTVGTGLDFCLMFGDFDFDWRQIEDLAFFHIRYHHICQSCLAMTAFVDSMHLCVLRVRHRLQGLTLVVGLASFGLVALLTIVFRFWVSHIHR